MAIYSVFFSILAHCAGVERGRRSAEDLEEFLQKDAVPNEAAAVDAAAMDPAWTDVAQADTAPIDELESSEGQLPPCGPIFY